MTVTVSAVFKRASHPPLPQTAMQTGDATWGRQLFTGHDAVFQRVARKWAQTSGLSASGPDAAETLAWETKIEEEFLRNQYTIWTCGPSANAAMVLALDIIRAESTQREPVVLYGMFSYLGSSGSNLANTSCPVWSADSPVQCDIFRGAALPVILPLPYHLEAAANQQQCDEEAVELFRNVCLAWRLAVRKVVAVVIEPVISWTGHKLSAHFLSNMQRVATELGVLLVLDEVITGFRLSGSLHCFALGFTPDVVILGKSAGFGLALLRRDLCPSPRTSSNNTRSSLRVPSTVMPLLHLQFMHAVLSIWVEKKFADPAWLAQRRQAAIHWICRSLPIDPANIYGEGLLLCGPFCVVAMTELEGPKNRLFILADGSLRPKDAGKVLQLDPNWKRNMDRLAAQLEQARHAAYECLFCRVARFLALCDASGATENALWDKLARHLGISRKQVKRQFQHLEIVKATRRASGAASGRVRSFTFDVSFE